MVDDFYLKRSKTKGISYYKVFKRNKNQKALGDFVDVEPTCDVTGSCFL